MSSHWVIWLLIAILAIPAVMALRRAGELFVVDVRSGRVVVVRGRIPSRLLHDLADVIRRQDGLRLRAVVRDGHAQVDVVRGELDAGHRQRLRNTISLWPVAKIRNAPVRRGAGRRA